MSICIDKTQDDDIINTTYYHKAFIAKKLYDSSCDKCSDVC